MGILLGAAARSSSVSATVCPVDKLVANCLNYLGPYFLLSSSSCESAALCILALRGKSCRNVVSSHFCNRRTVRLEAHAIEERLMIHRKLSPVEYGLGCAVKPR